MKKILFSYPSPSNNDLDFTDYRLGTVMLSIWRMAGSQWLCESSTSAMAMNRIKFRYADKEMPLQTEFSLLPVQQVGYHCEG